MILYHWTHRDNLDSIRAQGLLPSLAQGKMQVVWACKFNRMEWALAHISKRHNWSPDDMVCLRLDIPVALIKASCYRGVYNTDEIVSPESIVGVRSVDVPHYVKPQEYLG